MNRELCFIIENKDIYLEQVLVDYMDIPIFFLCKNDKQHYLALCTNITTLNYIVTMLPLYDVFNLIHGNISMREIILKQKEYWEIASGEEIQYDIVIKKKMESIELSDLPEENACFQVLTSQMESFVQEFDREYFANKYFYESEKKADFSELYFDHMLDALLKNIEQFIKLGEYKREYKIETSLDFEEPLYNQKMSLFKTSEVVAERSKQIENIDLFLIDEIVFAA